MDGWNTIVSFWGPAHFQVRTVSFRECNPILRMGLNSLGLGPPSSGMVGVFGAMSAAMVSRWAEQITALWTQTTR